MKFSDFQKQIREVVSNTTTDMFEAYINGYSYGVFMFAHQQLKLEIRYADKRWLYNLHGVTGKGDTLLNAKEDHKQKYKNVVVAFLEMTD